VLQPKTLSSTNGTTSVTNLMELKTQPTKPYSNSTDKTVSPNVKDNTLTIANLGNTSATHPTMVLTSTPSPSTPKNTNPPEHATSPVSTMQHSPSHSDVSQHSQEEQSPPEQPNQTTSLTTSTLDHQHPTSTSGQLTTTSYVSWVAWRDLPIQIRHLSRFYIYYLLK